MKEINDYGKVFEILVQKTQDYIVGNNLHAQILGISGGIDSTVVAAICHEVSERTGIPLIGRSLPTKFNKEDEITTADLVGKAFCDDYLSELINIPYNAIRIAFNSREVSAGNSKEYPIANGNIQARLRMIYLYNLASIHKGLVMDTDNLTENNLGYFTIHGDVGDFNPIGCLWKTEVFKLAEWIHNYYYNKARCLEEGHFYEEVNKIALKLEALKASLELKPTAGLGITDSDLDEIGAESYEQVDKVLQFLTNETVPVSAVEGIPDEIFDAIFKRYSSSRFKRKQLPIKIERDGILV